MYFINLVVLEYKKVSQVDLDNKCEEFLCTMSPTIH